VDFYKINSEISHNGDVVERFRLLLDAAQARLVRHHIEDIRSAEAVPAPLKNLAAH
jgi:hypothetical protein